MGAAPFTDNDNRIFFGLLSLELGVGIAPFLRSIIAPEKLHTIKAETSRLRGSSRHGCESRGV